MHARDYAEKLKKEFKSWTDHCGQLQKVNFSDPVLDSLYERSLLRLLVMNKRLGEKDMAFEIGHVIGYARVIMGSL